MIHILFTLLSLAQLVQGSSNSTHSDSCPPPNGATRSVWNILGSCALTLLICVWHTIHFDMPQGGKQVPLWLKGLCGLGSFFAPELMVAFAGAQWWNAHAQVIQFREKGYEWSMTHSFFAEMGGFIYCNEKGSLEEIDGPKFLKLCEANKVINPLITAKEIKDKSRSDALGKAIFALQLIWFMLQAVVRGSRGLAVTLVEIDTISMAVLSLLVIFLWWDKPLCPGCPHVFYSPQDAEVYRRTQSALSKAWKPEPSRLSMLTAHFACKRKKQPVTNDEETALLSTDEKSADVDSNGQADKSDAEAVGFVSCLITWTILGALHLVAWRFHFPTKTEKFMWRAASLILAGGSPTFLCMGFVAVFFSERKWRWAENTCAAIVVLVGILGVVSRAMLVGLMLASLRALPCSAYHTVSWTAYIPHL